MLGDICAFVGQDDIDIGDTIADSENPEALEYIRVDELVEVTPKPIRMRKLYLDPTERKRYNLAYQEAGLSKV